LAIVAVLAAGVGVWNVTSTKPVDIAKLWRQLKHGGFWLLGFDHSMGLVAGFA